MLKNQYILKDAAMAISVSEIINILVTAKTPVLGLNLEFHNLTKEMTCY